ncbi:hypothetical protein BDV25DRAFT_144303 [Aspergillus avenaceus]|uniref:Uncharacterized protein n=1 Tax=Aspergillus avenaceus TaxID=36643 RepID=A0A5N6THT7_ASPAV|nr:hypothetical protein BDV25DRAFT_144303 [Aspergillus avenaceus]
MASFLDLPIEVVHIIAEYLAFAHPPSLYSLYLTSKTTKEGCRAAMDLLRCHDIHVIVEQRYMHVIVERWWDSRLAKERYKAVRRLFLLDRDEARMQFELPRSLAEVIDWEHIAGFIKKLPWLTDVVPVPACILDALHLSKPRVRLHVVAFHPCPVPEDTGLIRSPYVPTIPPSKQAKLKSLTLEGPPLGKLIATQLTPCIDRSGLRELRILSSADSRALDLLSDRYPFNGLERLEMKIPVLPFHDRGYYGAVRTFLASLPSLKALTLDGWHRKIPLNIIQRKGEQLRELRLTERAMHFMSRNDIHRFSKYCPLLETLQFKIRRTQGDAIEVSKYHALGTMPRLKYLAIGFDVLDCATERHVNSSEPPPVHVGIDSDSSDSTDDGEDCYDKSAKKRLESLFINCAVDEALARAIYAAISATKSPSSDPLENLRLSLGSANQSSTHHTVMHVVKAFACDLVIERDVFTGRLDFIEEWREPDPMLEPQAVEVVQKLWPIPKCPPKVYKSEVFEAYCAASA